MSKQVQFSEAQIEALALATRHVGQAQKAIEKAQAKREGAYTVATRMAAEMGEDFTPAMDDLFSRIRTNDAGLATAFQAPKNDKGDGFKIPSSLSTAKSVLGGAVEYGVDLIEDGEPRAFGQIRKDYKAAKAALESAERSEAEVSRDTLADRLVAFAESLREREVDTAMGEWCDGMVDVLADLEADLANLMGDEGAEEADAAADAAEEAEQVEAAAA